MGENLRVFVSGDWEISAAEASKLNDGASSFSWVSEGSAMEALFYCQKDLGLVGISDYGLHVF